MRHLSRRVTLMLVALAFGIGIPFGVVLAGHQFGDVPNSNPFHADIDAIADAGVTGGCGGGNYCPKANVTREQMAAFMNRLGALAPGKVPVVNADKIDGLDSSQLLQGRVGGFAYAWAHDATSASYTASPTYSYNSAGGSIEITRTGTGAYTVEFNGLSLGRGHVQVTTYGATPGVCQVQSWGFSIALVRCFDMAGAAADRTYTVMFVD